MVLYVRYLVRKLSAFVTAKSIPKCDIWVGGFLDQTILSREHNTLHLTSSLI